MENVARWLIPVALLSLLVSGCRQPPPVSTADLIERLAVRGPETYNALAERRESADVALVEAALQHRRSRVRAACARLLGSYQDVTRVDALLPVLDDPVPSVRDAAASSLARLLETHEVLALVQRASTSDQARQTLMLALLDSPAELLEPEWLDWLLSLGSDPRLEATMFAALARHGPPHGSEREALERAYDRLLHQARRRAHQADAPWEVRVEALEFWTTFAPTEVVPLALYWSGSDRVSEYARDSALEMLGRCGQPWLLGYLRGVAENPALPTCQRRLAIESAIRYMEPEASAQYLLSQAAAASDPRLREGIYGKMASHPEAARLLREAALREFNRDLASQLSRLLSERERRRP